jgi:3-oxoacyl-[acyl-carrier-protein] synthase II
MLAGGTEAPITPLGLGAFSKIRALSKNNDSPTTASRPFDQNRDGFVAGEGAGVLILEELTHAKARNAPILAELIGYGATTDAFHITAPDPAGLGAIQAMKLALTDAQVQPKQIDYINAHGTSTPLNDRLETAAVKAVFNKQTPPPMSSIKSMIGHMLGAGGAVELIAACLTLQESMLPPTMNVHQVEDEMDLDYEPNQARQKDCEYVMSNSFGFGGHNVSLIIKKATA